VQYEPRCERCLIFTSNANTDRHRNSQKCIDGTARRERRERQLQHELGTDTEFRINNQTIENVNHFKYLGRPLTASGTDQIATNTNLQKARRVWGRISTILRQQGSNIRTSANFYKAVVQSTLLYASETWHLTDRQTLNSINVFHRRVARQISNRTIKRLNNNSDEWVYPDMDTTYKQTGLDPIETYIEKQKHNLLARVQNKPIYRPARQLERNLNQANLFWGPTTTPTTSQTQSQPTQAAPEPEPYRTQSPPSQQINDPPPPSIPPTATT
jgi:hypothetical protein